MATAYDDYDTQKSVDQSAYNGNSNHNRDRNETDFERNFNAKLEHGKIVKLMKNGDEYFRGQRVVVNSKKYRYFDVFLDDISNSMNANFGAVRKIHTPKNGHKINSLEEIEGGKTYVASGAGRFIKLNYMDIAEGKRISPQRLPPLNRDNEHLKIKLPQNENTLKNIFIYVYRNGDLLTPPSKIILKRYTLTSFDACLDEITEKVHPQNGAVFRLYNMEGEVVVSPSQLLNGKCYVAANKEKFRKCDYLSPTDFNTSPRLQRKSRLKPIKDNINSDYKEVNNEKKRLKPLKPIKSRSRSNPSSNPGTFRKSNVTYAGKPYTGWHKYDKEQINLPPITGPKPKNISNHNNNTNDYDDYQGQVRDYDNKYKNANKSNKNTASFVLIPNQTAKANSKKAPSSNSYYQEPDQFVIRTNNNNNNENDYDSYNRNYNQRRTDQETRPYRSNSNESNNKHQSKINLVVEGSSPLKIQEPRADDDDDNDDENEDEPLKIENNQISAKNYDDQRNETENRAENDTQNNEDDPERTDSKQNERLTINDDNDNDNTDEKHEQINDRSRRNSVDDDDVDYVKPEDLVNTDDDDKNPDEIQDDENKNDQDDTNEKVEQSNEQIQNRSRQNSVNDDDVDNVKPEDLKSDDDDDDENKDTNQETNESINQDENGQNSADTDNDDDDDENKDTNQETNETQDENNQNKPTSRMSNKQPEHNTNTPGLDKNQAVNNQSQNGTEQN